MGDELSRLIEAVTELLNDIEPSDDPDIKLVNDIHLERLDILLQEIELKQVVKKLEIWAKNNG